MGKRTLAILILGSVFLAACASSQPPTVMPSTSPLPPGVRGSIKAYGSDCQYFLLGLIPISFSPDTQAAIRDAKRDSKTDVLTDVTVDSSSFYWILFSTQCVRVRGMGVPREELRRLEIANP